jgi:hypothetical protein
VLHREGAVLHVPLKVRQRREAGYKGGEGDVETYFVRIFYEDILALGHFQAQIRHGPHYSPTVCQGNVELTGEIHRAHGRRG